MKDSIFWRIMAVAAVAGLFYVGHGLQSGTGHVPSLDLATPVHAQSVGITYSNQDNSVFMATCSDDGRVLHVFSRRPNHTKPVYLGSARVEDR